MSANSIIQFYLNTATTTANSSQHGDLSNPKSTSIQDTSPEINTTPSLLLKKNFTNLSILFKKIEQLPTPTTESNISVSPGTLTEQQKGKTSSSVPSFLSIPLKFFNSKKSTGNSDNALDEEISGFKNASPIDVIKDSPIDMLSGENDAVDEEGQVEISVEGTNSNVLKYEPDSDGVKHSDLLSDGYDPIYDTYISYLNYTTPEGELIL